jgi:hypothetical protein
MTVKTNSRSNTREVRSAIELGSNPGKKAWKKVIDLMLYLLFCALAGTGVLLAYRLPHGGGVDGTLFLGFGRHAWGDIHTWLAYFSIALLVVHLLLNWQWLVKVAASKHAWRLAAGILMGLFIVGAFLLLPIEKSEQNRHENAVHLQIDR